MCSTDAYEKQQPSSINDVSSFGGNALPSNSTTEALVSLIATINFIDCWLKRLEHNDLECSNIYFKTLEFMFQKIPVKLSKQLSLK